MHEGADVHMIDAESDTSENASDILSFLGYQNSDSAKDDEAEILAVYGTKESDEKMEPTIEQQEKMLVTHMNGEVVEAILAVMPDNHVMGEHPDDWTAMLQETTMLILAVRASQLKEAESRMEEIHVRSPEYDTRLEDVTKKRRDFIKAAEISRQEAKGILMASLAMQPEAEKDI